MLVNEKYATFLFRNLNYYFMTKNPKLVKRCLRQDELGRYLYGNKCFD